MGTELTQSKVEEARKNLLKVGEALNRILVGREEEIEAACWRWWRRSTWS